MQRALTSGFDSAAAGLEEHGKVARQQVGSIREHVAEAVELVGDLLAFVERQRAVEPRPSAGADLLGETQEYRQAALHVGGAEAVQRIGLAAAIVHLREEPPAAVELLIAPNASTTCLGTG